MIIYYSLKAPRSFKQFYTWKALGLLKIVEHFAALLIFQPVEAYLTLILY